MFSLVNSSQFKINQMRTAVVSNHPLVSFMTLNGIVQLYLYFTLSFYFYFYFSLSIIVVFSFLNWLRQEFRNETHKNEKKSLMSVPEIFRHLLSDNICIPVVSRDRDSAVSSYKTFSLLGNVLIWMVAAAINRVLIVNLSEGPTTITDIISLACFPHSSFMSSYIRTFIHS